MPKRTQGPETYDSDDGFVEDAPKSKKVKKTKSEALKAPRKENSSEPPVWELSHHRRIAVSDFKGKSMVDIRETYEKDGEKLPSKKGIMLTMEQFQTMLNSLPKVIAALESRGEKLEKPNLARVADGRVTQVKDDEEDEEDDDSDEDDA